MFHTLTSVGRKKFSVYEEMLPLFRTVLKILNILKIDRNCTFLKSYNFVLTYSDRPLATGEQGAITSQLSTEVVYKSALNYCF